MSAKVFVYVLCVGGTLCPSRICVVSRFCHVPWREIDSKSCKWNDKVDDNNEHCSVLKIGGKKGGKIQGRLTNPCCFLFMYLRGPSTTGFVSTEGRNNSFILLLSMSF